MNWNISALEMSENSKKIYKLLQLAKDLDEPSFQRKSQYQSFKVKKHIQPDDIQQFIEGSTYLYYDYMYHTKWSLHVFFRQIIAG